MKKFVTEITTSPDGKHFMSMPKWALDNAGLKDGDIVTFSSSDNTLYHIVEMQPEVEPEPREYLLVESISTFKHLHGCKVEAEELRDGRFREVISHMMDSGDHEIDQDWQGEIVQTARWVTAAEYLAAVRAQKYNANRTDEELLSRAIINAD